MAVTPLHGKVLRFTADDDTYDSQLKNLAIVGVRLSTVAADGLATLRQDNASGPVLMQLAALAKTADESAIPFQVQGGKLFVDITGAGVEVIVYLA